MWSGRLLFNRLPNFGRRVEAFWTNFSQCSAPLCSTSAWTYAFVCRYAKYVKSNVETPVVRTRRVGGRALAGRGRRGEKQRDRPRQKEREKGRAARRTEGEREARGRRNRGGYEKEGTRGSKERQREALLLRSMPRTRTRIHTYRGNERAPAREHKRISRDVSVAARLCTSICVCAYIYIKKTHTYIRAHHIVTWPG